MTERQPRMSEKQQAMDALLMCDPVDMANHVTASALTETLQAAERVEQWFTEYQAALQDRLRAIAGGS